MIRHVMRTRVRYADTDQMRVVYYARYLDYFEVARTELLRAMGIPYREFEDEGYHLPVTEAHVKYISSARYDEEIDVHTTLLEMTGPVVHIEYVITAGERTVATGSTKHVFVNAQSGKPCRPPQRFLEKCAAASM